MTGPKLNEGSTVVGERSGTKATAKYVRSSATKARAVLDLIRDLDVVAADEVLHFTDRHIAHEVRKVLASAVANAITNDYHDAEELYIVACFADEGPTLRRFRPRARGRATRINKRTCHITIVVAPMSEERLEIVQARRERQGGAGASGRPQSSAASRRARVERSRRRAAEEQPSVDEVEDAHDDDTSGADDSPESEVSTVESAPAPAETPSEVEERAGEWPGSVPATDDGDAPEGYEVKGNSGSMLYHTPDSRYYAATKADVWFDSVESAEAAGFTPPATAEDDAASASDASADEDADEAEDK